MPVDVLGQVVFAFNEEQHSEEDIFTRTDRLEGVLFQMKVKGKRQLGEIKKH